VLLDEGQDYGDDLVAGVNALLDLHVPGSVQVAVVGDQMQELYAMRREGGRNLLHSPDTLLRAGPAPWVRLGLSVSYRLTPRTCDFVNRCFRHAKQPIIQPGNHTSPDRMPLVVMGRARQGDLLRLLERLVAEHGIDSVMVCAFSVRSEPCVSLCREASAQLGLPLYTTHRARSEVSPALLQDKLYVCTLHQSKGDQSPCVLLLGLTPSMIRTRASATVNATTNATGATAASNASDGTNAVHVGVTRASEHLVIFQDLDDVPWPTLADVDALSKVAEIEWMDGDATAARRIARQPAPQVIRCFDVRRLVAFASNEVLALAERVAITTRDEPAGAPVTARPVSSVAFVGKQSELVADLFPTAILAAVERTLDPARPSFYEDQIRSNLRHPNRLPPHFRAFYDLWRPRGRLDGVRDYLQLAALYENTVLYDYPHELRQLANFDWVGADEEAYFVACVGNILGTLARYPDGGMMHARVPSRLCEEMGARVTGRVPFMPNDADYSRMVPWIITFDAAVTEETLLTALVLMWMRHGLETHVLFAVQNCVVTVRAQSADGLDALIRHMLRNKL